MERLAIIVPYRDRKEHLKKFVPYMEKYLSDDEIEYSIFIIEQADDKPFNRAKLLNIGFKETEKDFDYFAFHDVDMLPMDSDYSYPEGPTHLAAEVEQFNWGLAYEGYFGGVTLFDKENFLKINGYSNEYWGWGAEDDDVLYRCFLKEIPILRKDCRYSSLDHDRKITNTLYGKNLSKLAEFKNSSDAVKMLDKEGLNTLKYERVGDKNITEKSKFIQVKI